MADRPQLQEVIGVRELAAICEWFERSMHNQGAAAAAAGGDRLQEWAEARAIDLGAVMHFAGDQTDTMFRELAAGKLELREGIMATAIVAFQLGVDAERRRRDGTALPELGGQR